MSPRWTRKAGRPARMRRASAAASRLPSPLSPTAAKVKGSSPAGAVRKRTVPAAAPRRQTYRVDGAIPSRRTTWRPRPRGVADPPGVAPPAARQLARSPSAPVHTTVAAVLLTPDTYAQPGEKRPSQPPSPTVAPSAARTPLHLVPLTRRRQPRARAGG